MVLTLRFADELLPAIERKSTPKIGSAELAMAKRLIQSMEGPFVASKFKDTYRADLKRRIQEKIRNKETHALEAGEPDSRPKAEVIDLMAALKASLKHSGSEDSRRPARKSSKARKRA